MVKFILMRQIILMIILNLIKWEHMKKACDIEVKPYTKTGRKIIYVVIEGLVYSHYFL